MEIRVNIAETEPNEVLLVNFLRSSKVHPWPFREKVIVAIRSWWLPLALKEAGASEHDIRHHALAAIQCLQYQIWFLETLIGRIPQSAPSAFSTPIEDIQFPSPALNTQSTSRADDYPLRLD